MHPHHNHSNVTELCVLLVFLSCRQQTLPCRDNGIVCGFTINPNDGDKISTDHCHDGMQIDKTFPSY